MRKFLKILSILTAVLVVAVVLFYHLWLKNQYTVPILMYHHINEGENQSLYVSPDTFQRQMSYIKWRKYNVISLDELVSGIKEGRNFRRNTVVITFDDGYADNYKYAYPILKNLGFPATIFLITGYVGKDKEYLTWNEVRQMQRSGIIAFGSHTRNDKYLPDLKTLKEINTEIKGPKDDIIANTGQNVFYYCYPSGGFTEEIKETLNLNGYKGACTTNRGYIKNNKDVYELKRVKIKDTDFTKNPLDFWMKLSGYYNVFRKPKNPY